MDVNGAKIVTEHGVKVVLTNDNKQKNVLKIYNQRLDILREAVIAALHVQVALSNHRLICLDASGGTGLNGMLWKKYLGESLYVITSNCDRDTIKASCCANDVQTSEWILEESSAALDIAKQSEKELCVTPLKAEILLHQVAFNFICLYSSESIALFTDSMFANIRHNGVVCFLSPNISSQCFRSPAFVLRQYSAHVIKTEYVQELSARVLIANIVRSAAQHLRGVDILLTMFVEDHFLIVARVFKTKTMAISCAEKCRKIIHCLLCEERTVWPDTHSPVEEPYSLLQCECKARNQSKTAVVLGPVWTGSIFNALYIKQLISAAEKHFEKSKVLLLLEMIYSESRCEGLEQSLTQTSDKKVEPPNKKQKTEHCNEECVHCVTHSHGKNNDGDMTNVRTSQSSDDTNSVSPITSGSEHLMFYYDLTKKKYSDLPKLQKVVTLLHANGFRASRTHFNSQAIRTSANISELNSVIAKCFKRS